MEALMSEIEGLTVNIVVYVEAAGCEACSGELYPKSMGGFYAL